MTAPFLRGHCPECGPNRLAESMGSHLVREVDEQTGVWFEIDYHILKCRGCEEVYFRTSSAFSEEYEHEYIELMDEFETIYPRKVQYWPAATSRKEPDWASDLRGTDMILRELFADIYVALNNDLRILAAIGLRTAFDRASEILNVDPKISFSQKLKGLMEAGKIGRDEVEILGVLTDAGSAAAHRGWKPSESDLNTMMNIFESFIHRSFILQSEARKLIKSVPKRK